MENGESIKIFLRNIILLAKIHNSISDGFFSEKFNEKTFNFSLDFLNFIKEDGQGDNTRLLAEKLSASINAIEDILKELKYLALVNDPTLLLDAERNLLLFLLEITKKKKSISAAIQNNKTNSHDQEAISADRTKPAKRSKENFKLNDSGKKILDFIKTYPNKRTKDIIYEFNALSDRTVKRNLTELLKNGLVRKRVDNKAVYYYASE